ncbi:MAG: hypothetical protein JW882_04055 [Deltaproteobacteria bacterium]|nr:hypothetical protein [Deltaproteobacteria bacterium]
MNKFALFQQVAGSLIIAGRGFGIAQHPFINAVDTATRALCYQHQLEERPIAIDKPGVIKI